MTPVEAERKGKEKVPAIIPRPLPERVSVGRLSKRRINEPDLAPSSPSGLRLLPAMRLSCTRSHELGRLRLSLASKSPLSPLLNGSLAIQNRVLRTSSSPTTPEAPSTLLPRPLVNWSSTAFRSRSLAASITSTTAKMQTRSHVGHSHHHHHDNTYLTSTNKKDAAVRITRIGLYVNLGMAVGKGVGGYVFNSQALSADAIHSLTDLVSDVMTLAT
ncbi:hypothetical protein B0A49_10718, partial [Cryomyces minteri]